MPPKALKWLSLVGVIWLQSMNGTNTNFPAYSSQLKQILSISQLQLNNLAFALDAGKLIGFISGIAALYLPLWLVLLIGSILGFIGYGVQYLFMTDHIHSLSYPYVFLLNVLAGNSICWLNTVAYAVTIHNFPFDRQVAIGITSSYQGLSAKIYTAIVDALFPSLPSQKAQAYLLLNSILPLIVCLVVGSMCREVNFFGSGRNMKVGFFVIFFITIATGIYAIISSLGSISSGILALIKMIGLFVFLLLPLVAPLAEKINEVLVRDGEEKVHALAIEGISNNVMENGVIVDDDHDHGKETPSYQAIGAKEEIGVKLMLRRLIFWLYFFVYLFDATIGMVFLNNLGQIAESRGYPRTTSLVSLTSSFSFLGRLLPSILDYFFSRNKYMISRPLLIAALMGPMSSAFFLLLNKNDLSLYISTAIIGVCSGAITTIAVSITTELFGTENFSVNHNVVVANIPIGSFVFGSLAGVIYQREENGNGKCIGMQCYRDTFILWGSLCFLGTSLALILYARVRKFYSERMEVEMEKNIILAPNF